MGGVNKVTIPCHHETDERDAHPILVEEDVRVGAGDENREIFCELSVQWLYM